MKLGEKIAKEVEKALTEQWRPKDWPEIKKMFRATCRDVHGEFHEEGNTISCSLMNGGRVKLTKSEGKFILESYDKNGLNKASMELKLIGYITTDTRGSTIYIGAYLPRSMLSIDIDAYRDPGDIENIASWDLEGEK